MNRNEVEGNPNEVRIEESTHRYAAEVMAIPPTRQQELPSMTLSGTEVVALLSAVLGV